VSDRRAGVPILLYHSITDEASKAYRPFVLSPPRFENQMKFLGEHGFAVLSVAEYRAASARSSLPPKPVVLTFDDGLEDFYAHALPVLVDRGFHATVYVTTSLVGSTSRWLAGLGEGARPMMTWAQLEEAAAAGIECGAHGATHQELDVLPRLHAWREISRSRDALAERLSTPTTFSYPFGYYNWGVQELVRRAGFATACAVRRGVATPRDDVFALPRTPISDGMSSDEFASIVGGEVKAPRRTPIRRGAWRAARRGRLTVSRTPHSIATRYPVSEAGPPHPAYGDAALAGIGRQLELHGVRWALLRPSDPRSDDLDMLVAADDVDFASLIFADGGFVGRFAAGRGSHSFFLRWEPGSAAARWVQLDTVKELSFGPLFAIRTPLAEPCLHRSWLSHGVRRLRPEDEFWILVLHCLLDKRAFAARHRVRLQTLARVALRDGPAGRFVGEALPRGWTSAALVDAVKEGEWDTLARLGRRLAFRLALRKPLLTVGRLTAGVLGRLAERTLMPFFGRGIALALLGVDGAGKSTIASRVAASCPLPVRSVHMALWSDDESSQLTRRAATIALRPLRAFGCWSVGFGHRLLGRTVIFDRYVFDAHLPPSPPHARLKRLYLAALARACPAPDEVVLLDIPGRLAAERKDEDGTTLESQRRAYAALAARLPGVIVVDAAQPVASVEAAVNELLWRMLARRRGVA